MVIHIFIGSFIAYIAGTFMAADMTYRDGLIGLVGLTSYSLIGLLESNFTKWAIDVFMAMIGGKKWEINSVDVLDVSLQIVVHCIN